MPDWRDAPHRRLNPLTGEWVLVSPQRLQRPWEGEVSPAPGEQRAAYDPQCYLCPGNVRANGERTPEYESTFVFENDYAALLEQTPTGGSDDGLLVARSERGRCRVVCFSPRHDLDIGSMSAEQVRGVVETWAQEYRELGALPYVRAVTIFENRGKMMGASNPHPHGQIWADETLPDEMRKESLALAEYRRAHGACLLCAYVEREIALGERIVFYDDAVCAVVPFWAVWPFEVLLLPRRHLASIDETSPQEREAFASAMQRLVERYDRLFSVPFPYSMGLHQQPTDGERHDEWHLHAHYYPPLLRSSNVRKYMVGYEMLAQPQRDITPESAAERLRTV